MFASRNRKLGWMTLGFLVVALLSAGIARAEEEEKAAARLYAEAREALTQDEYRRAAEVYRQVSEEYSESAYAGDALYWEAFSLYRLGGSDELREALRILERQREDYPEAATRGDASDLEARVYGEMAKRGDADALEWLSRQTAKIEHIYLIRSDDESAARRPRPVRTIEIFYDEGEDDEDDVRIAALNALVQLDPDRAFPVIRKVLGKRDEDSAGLRKEALFMLSRMETPEAGDLLIDAAKNDPDARVRVDAVLWLSSVPGDEAIDAIEEIVRTSGEREAQEHAMMALSRHPSPRAASLLQDFAADEKLSRDARQEAVMALAGKQSPETLSFLMDLYRDLPGEFLKDEVVVTIARFDTEESSRWLLELVWNEREPVSTRETALSMIGDDPRIPTRDLVKMYSELSERKLRRTTIWVLSRRGDAEATEALLQIAREESDPELRFEAVSSLGQTGDPRAVEVLEEIIGQ